MAETTPKIISNTFELLEDTLELETHLIISKELKMIGKNGMIQGLITEENKMLNAFIKSISKE